MNQLTETEAKRLIYRLSFKVWTIFVFIFIALWSIVFFLTPSLEPWSKEVMDPAGHKVLMPLISLLLYPIALLSSYRLWMEHDAKKIWKNTKKLDEIYERYLLKARMMAWYRAWMDVDYLPSRSVIFKEYIALRNQAVTEKPPSKAVS